MTNFLRVSVSAATLTAALATSAAADITVSSKIDTEGGLLGNVIALALEDAGLPVERRLQLGGTQVVREALLSGQIDIYPNTPATRRSFSMRPKATFGKTPKPAMPAPLNWTPTKTT
ncbi:glycine betaine ABC transporter substrate-binding protein [Sulfitobacter sp. M13]